MLEISGGNQMRANLVTVVSVGLLCAWPALAAADSWSGRVCQRTFKGKLNCTQYALCDREVKYVLVDIEGHVLFELEPFTPGAKPKDGSLEPNTSLADYQGEWVAVQGRKTSHTVKVTSINPIESESGKKKERPGTKQAGPSAQGRFGKDIEKGKPVAAGKEMGEGLGC